MEEKVTTFLSQVTREQNPSQDRIFNREMNDLKLKNFPSKRKPTDLKPKKTLLEKQEMKFLFFLASFQIHTNQDSQGGTN